jgi:hypothetical protein
MQHSRRQFVYKYIGRALLSLFAILLFFVLFKELFYDHNPEYWIDMFYKKPMIIYLIYIGSEVFFGLIPPELFMIWALKMGGTWNYILNVAFLAAVSLGAGHLAYWIGVYLSKILGKQFKRRQFLSQHLPVFRKFGGLLIVIAALTPLPWSTISLLMGAIGYRYRNFTLFALSRILRYAVYGFIVFHTGKLLF